MKFTIIRTARLVMAELIEINLKSNSETVLCSNVYVASFDIETSHKLEAKARKGDEKEKQPDLKSHAQVLKRQNYWIYIWISVHFDVADAIGNKFIR